MLKEMEALGLQMVNNPNNNCGNCIYYNGEEEMNISFVMQMKIVVKG